MDDEAKKKKTLMKRVSFHQDEGSVHGEDEKKEETHAVAAVSPRKETRQPTDVVESKKSPLSSIADSAGKLAKAKEEVKRPVSVSPSATVAAPFVCLSDGLSRKATAFSLSSWVALR